MSLTNPHYSRLELAAWRACYIGACLAFLIPVGCKDSADWVPADEDLIRETVANISDARSHPEKLAELFTPEVVPDRKWLKATNGRSFVVGEITLTADKASVNIDLEDHFGEVQQSTTWKLVRSGERWVIDSAPID